MEAGGGGEMAPKFPDCVTPRPILADGRGMYGRRVYLGEWSEVGPSDGWDEKRFVEMGGSFTVWYGRQGSLVGVLAHSPDEDYEEGRGLIESGSSFTR